MRTIFLAVMLLAASFASATECPMHQDHQHAGMVARGNKAMGFDQEKTTHHFLMKDDGGIIQVEANDPQDQESRNAIRGHLSHIAVLFSKGDFDIPMFIHDRMPEGVPVMKELKDAITYKYEDIDRGGKVILASQNEDAVKAIHDFLRFQIEDHKTGDPLK
ncbi:hypothetical protein L0244_31115 [bacterium]|nr:hypothetical protein [bacterium]